MAIKINLKKNDETKNGFVGFSFTTFFWGLFIPIFRGDSKGFLKFFLIWLATFGLLVFTARFPYDSIDFDKFPSTSNFIISLFDVKFKYIVLAILSFFLLLLIISFIVWIFVAKNYNKNYTNKLLRQGYMPSEDDNFSLALLKEYGHLEYTEDELKDNDKMTQYKNIVDTVKKDEKKKFYMFLMYFIIFFLFIAFIFYSVNTDIGDETYLEYLLQYNN